MDAQGDLCKLARLEDFEAVLMPHNGAYYVNFNMLHQDF